MDYLQEKEELKVFGFQVTANYKTTNQRPNMGSETEEAKRSLDLLERSRPTDTGTKSAGCQRLLGLNYLVHRTGPPPASKLP